MHNNGWLGTELARDQDQVVVAKTKHAALLFSFFFKSKGFHIRSLAIFISKKETYWRFLQTFAKKCRERT